MGSANQESCQIPISTENPRLSGLGAGWAAALGGVCALWWSRTVGDGASGGGAEDLIVYLEKHNNLSWTLIIPHLPG